MQRRSKGAVSAPKRQRGRPRREKSDDWSIDGRLVEPTTPELQASAEAGWRALQLLMWDEMPDIFLPLVQAQWNEQGLLAAQLFGRVVVVGAST